MTTATRSPRSHKPAPQRHPISLRESVVRLGKPERVDREKGILYGVKILGLESENGRRYTPEAAKRAMPFYEGLGVYTNHPKKPDEPRDVRDRFGWLESIRLADDGGLRGNFHLLDPADPLSVKVMNAAEQKPDLFGFSHNAQGDSWRDSAGVEVVEEIKDVRSVDLVTEPATTGGLFEGRNQRQPMKLKQYLESQLGTLPRAKAKLLKSFLEDDAAGMDMMDADAPAESGGWRQSLAAVLSELTSSEDPEAHDKAKKIMAILKPGDVAATEGDDGEGDDAVVEDEDKAAVTGDGKPMKEEGSDYIRGKNKKGQMKAIGAKGDSDYSWNDGRKPRVNPALTQLQEQVTALQQQLKDKDERAALSSWLAEETRKRKLDVPAKLLETLTTIKDRKEIAARLDELKAMAGNGQRQAPRSQAFGQFTEGKGPANAKEFAEALRAGSR